MVSKRFELMLHVVLLSGLISSLFLSLVWSMGAQAVPPGSADEIRARTAPVGALCRAGEGCGGASSAAGSAGGGVGMSGEQIYNRFCFACHATGVTEAPRFANADDWAPRVAKGMDTLMASTLDGLNLMPAKGTCMACSDDELRATVDYMIETAQ